MTARNYMVWYAIFLHLWWGIYNIVDDPIASDNHGGVSWNIYVTMGGIELWGILFVVGSVLAIVALFWAPSRIVRIALLLPQQGVLTIGALGIIFHMLGWGDTQFEISRVLRVAPLALGAFFFHTLAILNGHQAH